MPIAVKWFSSDMRGAPTINGTVGSLIPALDACLLTGFGAVTAAWASRAWAAGAPAQVSHS